MRTNNRKSNGFKKTWQTKLSFNGIDVLRAATKVNATDVKKYVQFDHNKLTVNSHKTVLENVNHRVLAQLIKALSRGLSVDQAIAEISDEINAIKNFLEMYDRIDGYSTPAYGLQNFTISKELSRALAVEKEKLDKLEASFDILVKLARPKPYMTIPKNGEAASTSTRKFVAKSTLSEVLLTSILIATYRSNLMQYSTPLDQTHYQIFGSRIISNSIASDTVGGFGHIKFSSYIAEYNLYKHRGLALAKSYLYFKAFDLSKFFQSINIDLVAETLSKRLAATNARNRYFNRYSYRNIITSLLKFKYISSIDGTGTNTYDYHTEGLTIESHAQHTLANVFLFSLMEGILEEYNATYHNDAKKSDIISYVDDFVIYSNDKDEIERLFNFITSCLANFGINVNPNKSTDILSTTESYSTIKELIRLPARYYFDIPMESEYLADNEYLPLSSALEYDSTMYVQINQEYRPYLILTNGKSIVDEMIRITTSNLPFIAMDTNDKVLVMEIVAKVLDINKICVFKESYAMLETLNILFCAMICRDTMQISNNKITSAADLIKWMEEVLDCEICDQVKWKFRQPMYLTKGVNSTNSLNPFLVNSTLQTNFLKLTDFIYMLENHDYLSFFKISEATKMVEELNDDNILEVLQYFFMTSSVGGDIYTEMNKELFHKLTHTILMKYPSKIRFVVSILRQAFTKRTVDCSSANPDNGRLCLNLEFDKIEFSLFIRHSIEKVMAALWVEQDSKITNMPSNELSGFDFILESSNNRTVINNMAELNYSRTFNEPTLHSLTYFAYRAQRVLKSVKD